MQRRTLRETWEKIRRFFRREEPQDPYAYVTAPRKPRPPHRSAAVAEEEP
jgi:hypothetical protein